MYFHILFFFTRRGDGNNDDSGGGGYDDGGGNVSHRIAMYQFNLVDDTVFIDYYNRDGSTKQYMLLNESHAFI